MRKLLITLAAAIAILRMAVINRADPTDELARELAGPLTGVSYVNEKTIVADLTAGLANAFAFAIQNKENVDCLITQLIIDLTAAGGTATSVLDVDTVDAATDTGDDIIDGLDINTTGTFDSIKNPGTNGDGKPVKWGKKGSANDHLTGKILVADASTLEGKVVVKYLPLS